MRIRNLFLFLFLLSVQASPVLAADNAPVALPPAKLAPGPFTPSAELRPFVDFWKLVFTKYGEHQLVFHHRSHSGIIYSVLDLDPLYRQYSGKKLTTAVRLASEDEEDRIRTTLRALDGGREATTPFERRIQNLFRTLGRWKRLNYRDATSEEQIRSQTGVRERFAEGIRRSSRYLTVIEKIFRDQGLPEEIARLPLVESSFDYTAYSSVGAEGIWQFMRGTGKKYMRVDVSIDERRDPIAASRAAADYLGHAYEKLGSWPLAITSYNHGITGVLRGVKSTGSTNLADLIRSYESDSFGFASQNFYTEFVAALEVEQNAHVYFPNVQREPSWNFDEVRLGRAETFQNVVKRAGLNSEDLQSHNLALLKPVTSGRVKIPAGFMLKVPAGQGAKTIAALGHGDVLTAYRNVSRPVSVVSANRGKSSTKSSDQVASSAKGGNSRVATYRKSKTQKGS